MGLDWNGIWQERRTLLVATAAIASVALLGESAVGTLYAAKARKGRADIRRLEGDLAKPAPTRAQAQAEGEEAGRAEAAIETLRRDVLHAPREGYALEGDGGSPEVRYLQQVEAVRESLLPRARRLGVRIPETLGLPSSAPASEEEVAGVLRSLDAIERAADAAVAAGLRSIESIRIVDARPRAPKEWPGVLVQEVTIEGAGDGRAVLAWVDGCRERGLVFGPSKVEAKGAAAADLRAGLTIRILLESAAAGVAR